MNYYEQQEIVRTIKSLPTDEMKMEELDKYADKMTSNYIYYIIESFEAEEKRAEALDKYADKLTSNYIYYIIESFEAEEKRAEALDKHAGKMDPGDIRIIIESFKTDEKREEALDKYADKMDSRQIAMVITSCKLEKREELLDKYLGKMYSEDIMYVIDYVQIEEKREELLDKYIEIMDSEHISKVIQSFDTDEKKEKVLDKHVERLFPKDISDAIRSFWGEEKKAELLDKYADKMDSESIYNVMQRIYNEEKKAELLDKHADKMDSESIYNVMQHIYSEEKKAELLDKHADKMNSEHISDVILSFEADEKREELLDMYVARMESSDISVVIKSFETEEERAETLDKHADKLDSFGIKEVINSFETAEKKEESLDKYAEKMDPGHIAMVIASFKTDEKKAELLNKHAGKMSIWDIKDVICSFKTDELKLETLEKIKPKIDDSIEKGMTNSVLIYTNVLGNLKDKDLAAKLGAKYLNFESISKALDGKNKNEAEKAKNIMLEILLNINFLADYRDDEELTDSFEIESRKVDKWSKTGFMPTVPLFDKVPEDKIEIFDKKIWFKVAQEPIFNASEETKMALAEMAYCFGIFEKDVVELRGKKRELSSITEEEKRSGQVEDYEKRIQAITDMVKAGKLTKENLHMMFDGTNMKFDPAFYRFFMDNQDKIFADQDLMSNIAKIQKEMPNIMSKFHGRVPTIEECQRFFDDMVYENVNRGNTRLAELCKDLGLSQQQFEEYQELYEEQKKRDKENTIPQIHGKNYKMPDLVDPEILLIGEDKKTRCCQRLYGAGEECMRHSALSQDGRLIEIYDDDGKLIAQSWMWRNGNVVCFDSIEANAIESNTDAEKKKYVDLIEKTYREAAKQLIESSEKQIADFKEEKLKEIEKMDISKEEKEKAIKELEAICDESKIKRVTVGEGYWPISKKITERFSEKVVDASNGRVIPRQRVNYINDSDIQYVVAEAEEIDELKTNEARVEVKYREKRKIETEKGDKIHPDTIVKISDIEAQAHKQKMQLMSEISTVDELANIYGVEPDNLRVIHGEDWYYVYSDGEESIHVHDLARGTPRFEDEKIKGSSEMGKALDIIMSESMKEGKPVEAELREDTSYILLLELKKAGLIEQVGEDTAFMFDGYQLDEDSESKTVSEEEQQEILDRKEEIREKEAQEENTIMHHLKFVPTERYKRRLARQEKNMEGGEI